MISPFVDFFDVGHRTPNLEFTHVWFSPLPLQLSRLQTAKALEVFFHSRSRTPA
jgi:hypothetical protein